MDSLLPELQFLGEDHHREPDLGILKTLVETVYIILGKGGKEMRIKMKDMGAYLVMRELHLEVEDDGVRAACEKVVDVLMIEDENEEASGEKSKQEEQYQQEESAGMVRRNSDNTTAAQYKPITGIVSSEDVSSPSGKDQSSRLAKSPSAPPSTAPVGGIDEDDDDDNRIVEIF